MKIDTSAAAMEKLVTDKQWLVEREAKRFFYRFFVQTGVVDYDDILQEAWTAFFVTVRYFDRSKSPLAAFDPYIVLGIKGELVNWVNKTKRQFNYTFDEPEAIENIPEVPQDLMPSLDNLEIINPLSTDSMEFLTCLFTPPPELKKRIHVKVTSGKPYSKSILPLLLDWLKINYDEFNKIKAELKEKCVYSPLLSTAV